ncbi:MAG: 1-deoxy-D-xylulose-5-phosphate synthase [Clostridia bacterium]|jgi:1-deoxy-D-xylulose-5-phosphate synthase|nr:1-deoxy-D-xylulose-5-phosphate synthase [Clostridia bacterium]
MIIDKVNLPQDVKKLTLGEKKELAEELREKIINTVSQTGGHLASNLGVVELTIAIHSCFNMPEDKVIWDVGHQTYVHKILTGRKDKFDTLRKMNGIAGFPRTSESEYDSFDTGHSSTSISVALGMARARDVLNKKNKVVAVIGDGALTGGMALEALNDAGISKTNLIVILNDNEMSISKNTGGLSMFLAKLRTKKVYIHSNVSAKNFIRKIPVIGEKIVNLTIKLKNSIKQLIIPKMYFENIGFRYLGPIDGHNIQSLEEILNISKTLEGPILIHVLTKKGKGYKPAEENPNKYHSTSAFNIETGEKKKISEKDYSATMGEKLVELAEKNKRIVAVTAAMEDGTGLSKFAKQFPDRFFDVEIAEQHALGMVAGMAKEGLKPFIPIYSSFLQRGYDQLIHDIAMQELPVTICVDRAGIVGNDGETHQGILDLSFLNTVPKMNVMAPKNFEELEKMLEFAMNFDKPLAIRYPRGGEDEFNFSQCEDIRYGKSELLKEGKNVTVVAIGKMVSYAMKIAEKLQKYDIELEVINARFLKPLDYENIEKSLEKTKFLVTIEDNITSFGLASSVRNILDKIDDVKVLNFGYPDEFIKHGSVSEIEKKYGLDVESISAKIKESIDAKI